MQLVVKDFLDLSLHELYEISKLRHEVFVLEQQCLYEDLDDKDLDSIHIFYKDNNHIIAYLRIIPAHISSFKTTSFGRVCVKLTHRKHKLGRGLLTTALDYITQKNLSTPITIGAQAYLRDFYASFGFKVISEIYLDIGIEHIKMQKN